MILTSSMQSLVVSEVASSGQPTTLQFTIVYVPQVRGSCNDEETQLTLQKAEFAARSHLLSSHGMQCTLTACSVVSHRDCSREPR